MHETSGAARRQEAAGRARPDALAYWHLQERTPLDGGDPPTVLPEPAGTEWHMVPGWWLVPAILLSIPAWFAILAALF